MKRLTLPGAGGLRLAADAWGDPSAPPVLLLHGGGQTRGSWGGAGERLAALGLRPIAVDLRGHGESGWSPDGRYGVDLFADDVRALVAALPAPPALVGASLGGLAALRAVGEAPRARARALVLVDVAHRHERAGVERIIDFLSARPEGFDDPEEAAGAIAAYLPHRSPAQHLDGLERNLRRCAGRWVWHWDPRLLGELTAQPDPAGPPDRNLAAARAADVPILLVRGGISDALSAPVAAEFAAAVPRATAVTVAGAGHMVAGDRNDRFLDAIEPFLRRTTVPPEARARAPRRAAAR